MNIKKISVIGLGYVGLPLSCAIAKNNNYKVFGFDLDQSKVDKINSKDSPIQEEQIIKDLKEVELTAATDETILEDSDFFIICVPTPVDNAFLPNLKPLLGAAQTVKKYLKKDSVVIVESTVNPGVCESHVLPILEESGLKHGKDFELSHCPERINPGDSKWNIYNIPRNIGSTTLKGNKKAAEFYRSFIKAEINELETIQEAEATKIVENTFRDINIAYVNELAMSFDRMGINLVNVIKGASNKPFGFMPHYPGCGVGGHCIPVDPYYLIEKAKKIGFTHNLLHQAREINNKMPNYTVERLAYALNKDLKKSVSATKIGIMGMSYKANVADFRESPALKIKDILVEDFDCIPNVFEPYNIDMSTHSSIEEFLADTEVVILATNHQIFLDLDKNLWQNIRLVIDGRNALDKKMLTSQNIIYYGIGN